MSFSIKPASEFLKPPLAEIPQKNFFDKNSSLNSNTTYYTPPKTSNSDPTTNSVVKGLSMRKVDVALPDFC